MVPNAVRRAGNGCAQTDKLLSITFLESLAASGAQLALVRLETVRYRIIVLIPNVATVSEPHRIDKPAAVAECPGGLLRGLPRRARWPVRTPATASKLANIESS
jgi:hypothetical protein